MAKSNYKPNKIYLDYAASATPNPSSIHALGLIAKEKLERARKDVADILGARKEEIIFTSGGTEGNNLAIQGVVYAAWEQIFLRSSEKIPRPFEKFVPKLHIVTTNIEHPSVLETYKLLEKRKVAEISIVPVEANGIVDPKKIKKAIRKNTVLVSVMYANNEIGTIQPIREIAKEIRHFKKMKAGSFSNGLAGVGDPEIRGPEKNLRTSFSFPVFHTDAVQAVNYLDLNVEKLGVDMLTLSGSKIENAGRVGVLYKKASVPLLNIFGGGDQEGGLRPGTENLEAIIKFASALKETQDIKEKETKRLTKLRDYFFAQVSKRHFDTIVNGDLENRLPNNVNMTFVKIPSDLLVIELSTRGIMASSKSACKSSRAEGSYVIQAIRSKIGLPAEAGAEEGGVRFSLGKDTTKKDIDYTIKSLSQILQKLKKWYD